MIVHAVIARGSNTNLYWSFAFKLKLFRLIVPLASDRNWALDNFVQCQGHQIIKSIVWRVDIETRIDGLVPRQRPCTFRALSCIIRIYKVQPPPDISQRLHCLRHLHRLDRSIDSITSIRVCALDAFTVILSVLYIVRRRINRLESTPEDKILSLPIIPVRRTPSLRSRPSTYRGCHAEIATRFIPSKGLRVICAMIAPLVIVSVHRTQRKITVIIHPIIAGTIKDKLVIVIWIQAKVIKCNPARRVTI